ncbi:MAG: citryl-CoA lyase [Phycisphaerales bacterium]|nr:MAG: citryl-CoA lyase [Phycisphaerales bacterium]
MTTENPNAWTTAITRIKPNEVRVRGYNIAELMGNVSFGAMVHLILTGDLPDEKTGRLMDAILCSGIDHGATPPSALAARTVASTGANLSAAVAAGIMCINQHHGGAMENCAKALKHVLARVDDGDTKAEAAEGVLDEFKATKRRIAGFGHRIHTADPRTARLFELAEECGAFGRHCEAAKAVERVFADRGKPLPINVDGAIGAILADLGYEPEVMNGLFMIARCAGMVAHVREEQTRMKPMRKIDPVAHSYDGPEPRSL